MALFDGLRGGYKLVSFKDIPLKIDNYVTVKGIYKRAQSIFVKRFVATHIIIETVGDLGETDMMSYMNEDHNIIAQVGTYKLTIYPTDMVYVANMQGAKSVNGKTPNAAGNITLNANDIKLTTNQQTIQANIIRIDEALDGKVQIKDPEEAVPVVDDNYFVYGIDENGEEVLFDGGTIVAPPIYYFKTVILRKQSAGINHEISFNYVSQSTNAITNISDLRNDMNQFHGRISGNGHLGNRPVFIIELSTTNELTATAQDNWVSDTTIDIWHDSDFVGSGTATIDVYLQQF